MDFNVTVRKVSDKPTPPRRMNMLQPNQMVNLADLYENLNTAYSVDNLIKRYKQKYKTKFPERIIRDAINESFLLVDSIDKEDKSFTTYVILSVDGGYLWRRINE